MKKYVSYILTAVAIAMLALSIFIPWAKVDGRMDIAVMGIEAGVDLEVDFYPHKFSFDVTSDTGGGAGLLGGGMIGGRNVSETRYYVEGLEGFGAVGGILYRAPNPMEYKIQIIPPEEGRADLLVSLNREAPLWWPDGMEEIFTATLTLENITGMREVRINALQFYLYTGYDEEAAASSGVSRLVPFNTKQSYPVRSVQAVLSNEGDSLVHSEPITVREYHGRFGIGVDVHFEAETEDGILITTGSDYPGSHPPAAHQLQITQTEALRVFMLGATFPLMIITMALGAAALLLSFRKHPHTRYILLTTGILAGLCTFFFWAGTGAFLGLMDLVEPWFSYTPFLLLPVASSVLLFAASFAEWKVEEDDFVEFVPEVKQVSVVNVVEPGDYEPFHGNSSQEEQGWYKE